MSGHPDACARRRAERTVSGHGAAGSTGCEPAKAPRSNLTSLRRPLIVLAIGTFAIGTDAFVIGGVLPAVALPSRVDKLGRSPCHSFHHCLRSRRSGPGCRHCAPSATSAHGVGIGSVCCGQHPRCNSSRLRNDADYPGLRRAWCSGIRARRIRRRQFHSRRPSIRAGALGTVVAGMTVAQVVGVPFGAFVGASLGW
jgi:hypothetical protein